MTPLTETLLTLAAILAVWLPAAVWAFEPWMRKGLMPSEVNKAAWQRLIDEDLRWLLRQRRTLERDHIEHCLRWVRENKPMEKPIDDHE